MKVAIFGQYYQNDTRPIIRDIFEFFLNKKIELIIEEHFLDILYEQNLVENKYQTFKSYACIKNSVDLLISIGGDGTILRSITYVRDSGIPILGINAGRLGFLAKVQKEDIASFLEKIIQKKYTLSKRTLLCVETNDNSIDTEFNFALNEITVNRKDTTSMITVETHLNGEYLTSYWADGLIISTPTGSTGYSLSCGGPVLTPEVESFVITPIAPHNLNARPLVIPNNTVIKLKVSGREEQFLTSLDSRITAVKNEVELTIKKNHFDINMIEIAHETFLSTLRNKLLWGEDKRN
ncbi:NAD+ kinase [Flavobacterium croceum DSM 17960]|uniref:NAD kinase n=1 Tax=Flavobacterium croceum DSM 17960 TaxID=1121886 RepID=A0A2S4N6T0_9FLAO|nr:NAD kinase [Flavobacterium croceum]POS01425.1 NAD+ kinase [Flavobacterium croceum DSM 17960]